MTSLAFSMALAIAQLMPAPTPSPPPWLAMPGAKPQYFEIVNTGSTNIGGYHIYVARDGTTIVHVEKDKINDPLRYETSSVDPALAARVFADLDPIVLFPAARATCVRSASFGSVTFIVWRGRRSPALDCPEDPAYAALRDDVRAVVRAVGPKARFRRPIGPLPSVAP